MDGSLQPLLPLFAQARAARSPLVLATVVATRGSTYRKAGAQMLIAPDGRYAGLLSGGCLEADLVEHAQGVFAGGTPKLLSYDNSGEDDALWGLGAGCDGGMDIWLVRLDPSDGWAPLGALFQAFDQGIAATYGLVLASAAPAWPAGRSVWATDGTIEPQPHGLPAPVTDWLEGVLRVDGVDAGPRVVEFDEPRLRLFVSRAVPAREMLVIGAGPDAVPVVDFAASLGWRLTVADHRPAYATADKFPRARRVVLSAPKDLPQHLALDRFDAAVIMTHHFATDLAALRILADVSIPYVGLLGPAARRRQLLSDLGATAGGHYGTRLRAPVGLDLGGRDPASIALAIVAEIQASFHGKDRTLAPRQTPVA